MGIQYSKTRQERQVGAHIAVRRLSPSGPSSQGRNNLTKEIVWQLEQACNMFRKSFPDKTIIKIEYIMNDKLYNGFDDTRKRFRRQGTNTNEMILFHGTNPSNIDRYKSSNCNTHKLELSRRGLKLGVEMVIKLFMAQVRHGPL